jgi:hypothetical protein
MKAALLGAGTTAFSPFKPFHNTSVNSKSLILS